MFYTPFLHRARAVSFAELSNVSHVMYGIYREACQRLGLFTDKAEWTRALRDRLESSFRPFKRHFR